MFLVIRERLNESTWIFTQKPLDLEENVNKSSIAFMISALVFIVVCFVLLVRPKVSETENDNALVLNALLDTPKGVVSDIRKRCADRLAILQGNEIDDIDEKLSTIGTERSKEHQKRARGRSPFKKKNATREPKSTTPAVNRRSHFILLGKLGIVFIVTALYFISVTTNVTHTAYLVHYIPQSTNLASYRQFMTREVLMDIKLLSLQNPTRYGAQYSSYPDHFFPQLTRDDILEHVLEMKEIHEGLVYGNEQSDGAYFHHDHRQDDLLLTNSCEPGNTACLEFGHGILEFGFFDGILDYTRVAKLATYCLNERDNVAIENGGVLEGDEAEGNCWDLRHGNSSITLHAPPQLKYLEEMELIFLSKSLSRSTDLYLDELEETIDIGFMTTQLGLFIGVIVAIVLLYIVYYRQLFAALDGKVKRTRSMLLMIPIEKLVNMKSAQYLIPESVK